MRSRPSRLSAPLPHRPFYRLEGDFIQGSPGVLVTYEATAGIIVPERFLQGDLVRINLDSPADGVKIQILSLRGTKVRTLADETNNTFYDIPWDLTDDDGKTVGSGPYLFHVVVNLADGSKIEDRVIAVVTR